MNLYTVDVRFDFEFEDDAIQELLDAELLDQLHQAAIATLVHQQVSQNAGLTILLTDDEALQTLNREFRGIDQPTDVLSFPSELEIPEVGRYLGDIAISVPTAMKQAAGQKHPASQEFELLAVHGVLHLLGHDHAEEDEKARMWAAQDEILEKLRKGDNGQ
ncbi:MAG: rRNA maturation RNase YbeY [Ardenticatenaceae bacterium]|nr:rRNA maturation RNase YbeY [Ardenticatenaceae bacterium]